MNDQDIDYSIYYREFHDDSEEHAKSMSLYLQNLLRPFLPEPGEFRVLDIGCGMGFALQAMRDAGFGDVYGIDISAEQVAACKGKGLPVELVCDSAGFLRKHHGVFDIVLLMDVLEHLPVPDQIPFLRSIHYAMSDKARLIITVPNASSPLSGRWRYNDHTHHCSFTEHSLHFVLANAGFSKIEILSEPLPQRPSLRLWRAGARAQFRKSLVRYLWGQLLAAELGDFEKADRIPMDLNLHCCAFR
jgi:SAM-dependent methyltransferase